jgi:C2H2-type zinc finger/Zinc finger, C2H2 type
VRCGYCDATFDAFAALHEHLVRRHGAASRKQAAAAEERQRRSAAAAERRLAALVCGECGKQVRSAYKLRLHAYAHSGAYPHRCAHCDAGFVERCRLAAHVRTKHEHAKTHACRFCARRFADKSYVAVHERRRHTHQRPFMCEQCGKAFACRTSLKRHRDTHSDAKKYQCPECGKAFKFVTTLSTHRHRLHRNPKPKTHACPDCPAAFTTRSDRMPRPLSVPNTPDRVWTKTICFGKANISVTSGVERVKWESSLPPYFILSILL